MGALETGPGTRPAGYSPGRGENGRLLLHRRVSSVWGGVNVSTVPTEARGTRFSGAGATGACELPSVYAGNGTWVLCWNSVLF